MSARKNSPWKEATEIIVRQIDSGELTYGELIPHSFFEEIWDEPLPNRSFYNSEEDYLKAVGRRELSKAMFIVRLKEELLQAHRLDLESVLGKGYSIIPPKAQTKASLETFFTTVGKATNKCMMRLSNVRVAELSSEEVRQNTDAIAKIASISAMMSQKRFGQGQS